MYDKAKIKSVAAPVLIIIAAVVTVMIIAIAVERTNESNRLKQDQPGSVSLDNVPKDIVKFVYPSPSPTASQQDIAESVFLRLTAAAGDTDQTRLRVGWYTCVALSDGYTLPDVIEIVERASVQEDTAITDIPGLVGTAVTTLCAVNAA